VYGTAFLVIEYEPIGIMSVKQPINQSVVLSDNTQIPSCIFVHIMIRAKIEDDVAFRVSQLTGKPLTKGFNKQVVELCDEVEKLRKKN